MLIVIIMHVAQGAYALEVLATWGTFSTTTGLNPATNTNWTSPNGYFSNLDMSFVNMVGAGPGVGGPTYSPSFDSLNLLNDGDPTTGTGQYIQLNFTKNPTYLNHTVTITGVYFQLWNNSPDPGNSRSELHFYSTTGGFVNGTNNQMASIGSGPIISQAPAPPTSPLLFSPDQFNVISPGVSDYQIRMAPDNMAGPGKDPHIAFTSFSNAGGFIVPTDSVVVLVGTVAPEPGSLILVSISLGLIVFTAMKKKGKPLNRKSLCPVG